MPSKQEILQLVPSVDTIFSGSSLNKDALAAVSRARTDIMEAIKSLPDQGITTEKEQQLFCNAIYKIVQRCKGELRKGHLIKTRGRVDETYKQSQLKFSQAMRSCFLPAPSTSFEEPESSNTPSFLLSSSIPDGYSPEQAEDIFCSRIISLLKKNIEDSLSFLTDEAYVPDCSYKISQDDVEYFEGLLTFFQEAIRSFFAQAIASDQDIFTCFAELHSMLDKMSLPVPDGVSPLQQKLSSWFKEFPVSALKSNLSNMNPQNFFTDITEEPSATHGGLNALAFVQQLRPKDHPFSPQEHHAILQLDLDGSNTSSVVASINHDFHGGIPLRDEAAVTALIEKSCLQENEKHFVRTTLLDACDPSTLSPEEFFTSVTRYLESDQGTELIDYLNTTYRTSDSRPPLPPFFIIAEVKKMAPEMYASVRIFPKEPPSTSVSPEDRPLPACVQDALRCASASLEDKKMSPVSYALIMGISSILRDHSRALFEPRLRVFCNLLTGLAAISERKPKPENMTSLLMDATAHLDAMEGQRDPEETKFFAHFRRVLDTFNLKMGEIAQLLQEIHPDHLEEKLTALQDALRIKEAELQTLQSQQIEIENTKLIITTQLSETACGTPKFSQLLASLSSLPQSLQKVTADLTALMLSIQQLEQQVTALQKQKALATDYQTRLDELARSKTDFLQQLNDLFTSVFPV